MHNTDLKFLKIKKEKHPTRNVILEYLDKPDAIGALILDSEEKYVYLVKQYRPGTQDLLLEIPAGIIEKGESPRETLYREVREEVGLEAEAYNILFESEIPLILSPGYTTESLYVYILKLKSEVEFKEKILDEGEDLTIEKVLYSDIFKVTRDFKTNYAFLLYEELRRKK